MSELPTGWKTGKLMDLARVRNGYAFKSKDFIDSGIPLIRQSNLVGDNVEIEKAKCLPLEYLDAHERFKIEKGDVLIGMSGSIGKLSWYRHDTPALQNQRTGLLQFEEPESKGWVCYFLNSVERQLNQTAKGVAVQNISSKEIEALSLPIPPLPEQRRIVARIEELFSRLDAGVAALRHAKAQLQRYRQSVLAAAVTGQLTQAWREQHPDTEPADELLERILEQRREQCDGKGKYKEPAEPQESATTELPRGWVHASLEALTLKITDGEHFKPNVVEDGVPFLSAKDVRDHGVEFENALFVTSEDAARFRLRCGPDKDDILIVSRGATVGRCCIVQTAKSFCLLGSVILLKISNEISSRFVLSLLKSPSGLRHLTGVSGSTAQQAIYLRDIKALPLTLPPLAEQHQIVAEVEARTTAIDHLEAELDRQITRSNRLRQSTLASAFGGKL